MRGRRVGVVLWVVATLTLISYTLTGGARWRREEEQVERESMEQGAARVASVCSSLPPSSPLLSPALGPGVEVVLLPSSPGVQVCIPHKAVSRRCLLRLGQLME